MPTLTDYTYSVATDTANGTVVLARLDEELRESDIVTALDGISVDSDVLTVTYKDALSTADETLLDDTVNGHDGEAVADWTPNYDDSGNQIVSLYADTAIGLPAVSVLDLPEHAQDLMKSWQITAEPLTTEILDIQVGDDLVGSTGVCYLAGGEYRCRTSANEESAMHFALVDRDDILGLFSSYGLSRTQALNFSSWSGGTFADVAVGEYIHGSTSAARAKILAKGTDYFEIEFHEVGLTDGETVTFEDASGTATGVSAVMGNWSEGDVIEVIRSVKDEWLEGLDQRTFQPGGSKEIPAGMYFRFILYNSHSTDSLRVKVSLLMATA